MIYENSATTMLPQVRPRGLVLKHTGNILLIIGLLVLSVGLIALASSAISERWRRFTKSLQRKPVATSEQSVIITAPPEATLSTAKQDIPLILTNIYLALNDGNPQSVRTVLHPVYFTNPNDLDALCQPFNYRAHYISSIVERPNHFFMARVHTLYKSVGERVTLAYFKNAIGKDLYLHNTEADPLTTETGEAKEIVRKFIFAARAGEWDVVEQLSSASLAFHELRQSEWQKYLQTITDVNTDTPVVVSENGVKLEVRTNLKPQPATGMEAVFWVDPFLDTPKVVVAFYTKSSFWGNHGLKDMDTMSYTLRRFKVSDPAEHTSK